MLRTDIVCNIIINITIISNMIKRASNIKLIIIDLKIAFGTLTCCQIDV